MFCSYGRGEGNVPRALAEILDIFADSMADRWKAAASNGHKVATLELFLTVVIPQPGDPVGSYLKRWRIAVIKIADCQPFLFGNTLAKLCRHIPSAAPQAKQFCNCEIMTGVITPGKIYPIAAAPENNGITA